MGRRNEENRSGGAENERGARFREEGGDGVTMVNGKVVGRMQE